MTASDYIVSFLAAMGEERYT